ncbi:MAG: hypothetical protein BZY88_17910 [SAR202 cluster bacterium Io17-Chloro-G9]|nr:MAG: hypothetical protein BZY88_17910 [SAR202 cluster bacterium Io17-Chloro-G9]
MAIPVFARLDQARVANVDRSVTLMGPHRHRYLGKPAPETAAFSQEQTTDQSYQPAAFYVNGILVRF